MWAKEIDLYSTNQDCIKMLVGNKLDKVFVEGFTDSSVLYHLNFFCDDSFFLCTLVYRWIFKIRYDRKTSQWILNYISPIKKGCKVRERVKRLVENLLADILG